MYQLVVNLEKKTFRGLIMNRTERRKADKEARKSGKRIDYGDVKVEAIQPWADVLMKMKLPNEVLKRMIELTDDILEDGSRTNWGHNLAGQIKDEPLVPHEKMQEVGVYQFFMDAVGHYVDHCMKQMGTSYNPTKEKHYTMMKSCWVVEQQPGEYNPIHIHTECSMSTVMYLKIPEFLPSTKPERDDDGCIMFIGQAQPSTRLTRALMKIKPEVGDFFLFPAHLQHTVYPYQTNDNFARRSVSFNADFMNEQQYQQMVQQQQMMQRMQQQNSPKIEIVNETA